MLALALDECNGQDLIALLLAFVLMNSQAALPCSLP